MLRRKNEAVENGVAGHSLIHCGEKGVRYHMTIIQSIGFRLPHLVAAAD